MAKIRIKDLKLSIIIGINEEERIKKQKVLINVELKVDSKKAIKSDNINDTFDYKTLTKKIIQEVEPTEFFLLEKLADFILRLVTEDGRVLSAKVEVDKPGALHFARSVSVEVEG